MTVSAEERAAQKARNEKIRLSAAQSFSRREVFWLQQLLQTLVRGGDARSLVRAPEAAAVHRKVRVMKARVGTNRARRVEVLR